MKYSFNQERLSYVFLGISYGKIIVFKTVILKPRVGIFFPFLFFVGLIMFPPEKKRKKKKTSAHREKRFEHSIRRRRRVLPACRRAVLETIEVLKVKIQNKVAHRQVEEYQKKKKKKNSKNFSGESMPLDPARNLRLRGSFRKSVSI